ncbi:MAG TPA: rhombosortase [Lacunisphaera sp.]|nr:rhombosortase [Lacunisphaera sp.]
MKTLRVPLLLFALPAVLLAFAKSREGLFLLDRAGVEAGQFWRLWSGHWVHFSFSHAALNLAVLLAAGAWLEQVRPGLLWRHVVVAAPLTALCILYFEPSLQAYGGLSGLAAGVVLLLALHQLIAPGRTRWIWIAVVLLLVAKAGWDAINPGTLLVDYRHPHVQTSRAAHAAGALVALGLHGTRWLCHRTQTRAIPLANP